MEENATIQIDKAVLEGYAQIMKDWTPTPKLKWEKKGEYFDQFSIYQEKYNTKVTNKVEEVCQVGVTF